MKSLIEISKLFGILVLTFLWLYLIVVQLPLLLAGGAFTSLAGWALVILSVAVTAYASWKIFQNQFTN
ncbi:hypothetical protein [Xanthomonas phage JGB6]|nr:hypothetical protein [Xanthomonas phage JGB6]